MKEHHKWQEAVEKFDELMNLVQGENTENTEYYGLLEQLHGYDYCMSDEFKEAFYNELENIIEFEKEWRESMKEE